MSSTHLSVCRETHGQSCTVQQETIIGYQEALQFYEVCLVLVQASRHQSLDDVAEYFGGLESEPARPGEGGAAVFKPGWEDIFRMNQKQLEVAVRRMWNDPGALSIPSLLLQTLYNLCDTKPA